MSILRRLVLAASVILLPASAFANEPVKPPVAGVEQVAKKCEHGVKTTICTRCNPELEAVYKAKGDWCGEHARPESQCVICHPKLAEQGIK